MRKIGTITPLWNQEMFIRPHFKMISGLDKNVVMMQNSPLGQYANEHGYSELPDKSEEILRSEFPNVEIHHGNYRGEFGSDLYNEILPYVQDCDIVLRLDPDMLMNDKDWTKFIDFIRFSDYDCYRVDFQKCTVNYYMTGDFNHGTKDAREYDILAFSPKKNLVGVLNYEAEKEKVISWDDFVIHHFRGWNKPKSTPPDWIKSPNALIALKDGGGRWINCPKNIRKMFL